MRPATVRILIPALAIAALCATESLAQAPPPDAGSSTQTQTQRDQTPINLDIIEKQKPEIEIYSGPDDPSQKGLQGIVVVPEEAPPPPSPAPSEPPTPPKKNSP